MKNLFSFNTTKHPAETIPEVDPSSIHYISAFNTKRNPDLLIPGGPALKGNMYFSKKYQSEAKEEGETVSLVDHIEAEPDSVLEDDDYQKLKT